MAGRSGLLISVSPWPFFSAPLGLLPAGCRVRRLAVASLWRCWPLPSGRSSRPPRTPHPERVFFPLVLGLMFFGPVYLTLQDWSLGCIDARSHHRRHPRPRTAARIVGGRVAEPRPAQAFAGIADPGAGWHVAGLPSLVEDAFWVWRLAPLACSCWGCCWIRPGPSCSLASAQGLMTRNLGLHSNVFSLASHACASGEVCTWIVGRRCGASPGGCNPLVPLAPAPSADPPGSLQPDHPDGLHHCDLCLVLRPDPVRDPDRMDCGSAWRPRYRGYALALSFTLILIAAVHRRAWRSMRSREPTY